MNDIQHISCQGSNGTFTIALFDSTATIDASTDDAQFAELLQHFLPPLQSVAVDMSDATVCSEQGTHTVVTILSPEGNVPEFALASDDAQLSVSVSTIQQGVDSVQYLGDGTVAVTYTQDLA